MKTIPLDTRKRILAQYDTGKYTREQVGGLFGVSLAFVKKLLSQRLRLGHVEPLYANAGRKPTITPSHRDAIRELIGRKPGVTLRMIRDHIGLPVTSQAVHAVLGKMGMTLKKSHSGRRSKTAKTSAPNASRGRRAWAPHPSSGSSSSTNPRRKRT
jgi:transposase